MLSIENSADPPCSSSKLSSLRTDERTSEKLAFQEADPVGLGDTPTPNFSIRNYVFSSRSKGIETSWPLHQRALQLCLKHGVKDILPPFEPPDLVRAHSLGRREVIEQPTSRSEADQTSAHAVFRETKDTISSDRERNGTRRRRSSLPLAELVAGCLDQAQYPSPEDKKSVVDQEGNIVDPKDNSELAGRSDDKTEEVSCQISRGPCLIPVNSCITEEQSELVVSEPAPLPQKLPASRESLGKKCRLVVKLSSAPDTSRAEDLVSNCSTVTDPMASKICPVCKIFASTSNTTLNAHIDQCLSVESSTKQDEMSFLKLKVKPRKKRLMVDIYTTAPRCTLEDLDRRNGTNWASELALAAAITEVRSTSENQKSVPSDSRISTSEGAVYVDSNGVKLRILSKFDDTPPVVSRDNFRPLKVTKDKENENILISKKKHLGLKHSMNKKSKLQRKKLGSFKHLNAPIEAQPGGDVHTDAHQEESLLDLPKAQDQSMSSRPATLRQWVCSKRSDLLKKLNNKDICRTPENLLPITTKLAGKSQSDIGDSSAVVGQILSSKSSEGIPISPITRSVDFLSSAVHKIDDRKKEPPKPPASDSQWSSRTTNGLRLRLSKSLGASVSFPSSKREEIHSRKMHKPSSSSNMTVTPADCSHPSAKGQTSAAVEKKVDPSDKPTTFRKCRKHRTILRTCKRRAEISTAVLGETHDSIQDWDGDIERANKKLRTRQSKIFEDVTRSVAGNIADEVSPCQSNIPECRNAVDQAKAGNQVANTTMSLASEAGCCNPEIQMQVEVLVSEGRVTNSTLNIIDNSVTTKFVDLENDKLGVDAVPNPYKLMQLHLPSPSVSKAHAEALVQGSFNKHVRRHVRAPSDEVVNEDIQFSGDMEVTEGNDSSALWSEECQANPLSLVQEFGACLTNHGDLNIETPQESSSITSNREGSNRDHSLDTEREPSESPVSTASSMSLPSLKDIRFKESEFDLLARDSVVQGQLELPAPSNKSIAQSEGSVEGMNLEAKAVLQAKEHEQISNDKPYCCSCRESLSRDSQFLRQSAISGTLLASKGKQVSRLSISSRTSSSFTSYQSPRKKLIANSSLELPARSISSKASSEAAINFPAGTNSAGSSSPSSHTQIPSPSNPVLRLMGKNLLVMNKEEMPPQTPNSEYSNGGNFMYPLGVARSTSVARQDNFQYHHPSVSAVMSPYPSMGNHHNPLPRAPFQNAFMMQPDQYYLQKSYKEPIPPSRVPYMMKEVIVIDDSPENVTEPKVSLVIPAGASPAQISVSNPMPPRSFSCFTSQGHFFSRDASEGSRPVLPMLYPRVNTSVMKRESTSECPGPFVPSPFMFQSPTGRMSPSMYYSQTLR